MKRSVIPIIVILCWAAALASAVVPDSDPDIDGTRKCPPNELYRTCGYRCAENCNEQLCVLALRPCEAGCFCEPTRDYMRINRECVRRGPCPAVAVADVLEP